MDHWVACFAIVLLVSLRDTFGLQNLVAQPNKGCVTLLAPRRVSEASILMRDNINRKILMMSMNSIEDGDKDDSVGILSEKDMIMTSMGHSLPDPKSQKDAKELQKADEVLDIPTTETALEEPSSSIPTWLAYVLLNLVAVIWGTQHSVIKSLVDTGADPALVNFSRFALAAAILSPWTPGFRFTQKTPAPLSATDDEESPALSSDLSESTHLFPTQKEGSVKDQWIAGLELGIWMFLGYAFQAVGLQTTIASRSAFLLYLNVKFVPFFAWVLLGRKITAETWISALIAFLGTALMCTGNSAPLNIGDAWSLAAAAASAMFILRLEKYASVCSPLQLNSANLLSVSFLCAIWTYFEPGGFSDIQSLFIDSSTLWPLLYLGIITTALTNLIQTIGQQKVPAERAAIIYAADPVYGAFFAWLLLGETLDVEGYIGAAMILGAAVYSNLMDSTGKQKQLEEAKN